MSAQNTNAMNSVVKQAKVTPDALSEKVAPDGPVIEQAKVTADALSAKVAPDGPPKKSRGPPPQPKFRKLSPKAIQKGLNKKKARDAKKQEQEDARFVAMDEKKKARKTKEAGKKDKVDEKKRLAIKACAKKTMLYTWQNQVLSAEDVSRFITSEVFRDFLVASIRYTHTTTGEKGDDNTEMKMLEVTDSIITALKTPFMDTESSLAEVPLKIHMTAIMSTFFSDPKSAERLMKGTKVTVRAAFFQNGIKVMSAKSAIADATANVCAYMHKDQMTWGMMLKDDFFVSEEKIEAQYAHSNGFKRDQRQQEETHKITYADAQDDSATENESDDDEDKEEALMGEEQGENGSGLTAEDHVMGEPEGENALAAEKAVEDARAHHDTMKEDTQKKGDQMDDSDTQVERDEDGSEGEKASGRVSPVGTPESPE